jgi:hypothetical protein
VKAVPTIGLRSDQMSDQIPASRRDLVQCPPVGAPTTVMPDGYPQTSVVWCDVDGECLRVNTKPGSPADGAAAPTRQPHRLVGGHGIASVR